MRFGVPKWGSEGTDRAIHPRSSGERSISAPNDRDGMPGFTRKVSQVNLEKSVAIEKKTDE
jgi:hypothetical protein